MGTLVRNWFLKHFKTITKLVETLDKHAEIKVSRKATSQRHQHKSSSKIENSSKVKGSIIIDAGHGPEYTFGMYTFRGVCRT